jgi:hypothetical protein
VTATRDRRSDAEQDAELAWDERSIFGKSRGLPWWGAVLLAFALAAIAAAFDMQRQDSLGKVYQGAYIVGCVAAICLVRRRSLFGPMVQPPLVFAATAIAAVLLLAPSTGGDGGFKTLIFTVALPLTSNFPTMAATTAACAAIGVFRLWRERDPDSLSARPPRSARAVADGMVDLEAPDEFESGTGRRRGFSNSRDSGGRGGRDSDGLSERRRGRRGDPDTGRGRSSRRARPDADPEAEGRRGMRGRSGRDPRADQSDRSGERLRGSRRGRDGDPPPRRRDSTAEPRLPRADRSRRDTSDRGAPLRRRPPDPYR